MDLTVYLGGPIRRDDNHEIDQRDTQWRHLFTKVLKEIGVSTFDPCVESMKSLSKDNQKIPHHLSIPDHVREEIYNNDIRGLHQSCMAVFNFDAFDNDNYPALGSLFEIGWMTNAHKLCIISSNDGRLRNNPMYYTNTFVSTVEEMLTQTLATVHMFKKTCNIRYEECQTAVN